MSRHARAVLHFLDRWERRGLVSSDLADTLRADVADTAEAGDTRFSQYVMASTGAVVLLIAGGVFLNWSWPLMSEQARAGVLATLGVVVHIGGTRFEDARRWIPASYLLQIAGLALLLVAVVYTKEAWDDATLGGVLTGLTALVVPLVLAPRAMRRNAVMPAAHLCFGLSFLAVFLDRVTPLSADAIVWTIDAVLLASTLALIRVLRHDPDGTGHPWALNAFATALYSGFVMIVFTGVGPLSLQDEVAYPLDFWLGLVTGLALWGIHRAPPGLRREWFEDQLAISMIAWIPLGMFTSLEAMNGPAELALALVGGAAVAGFWYGNRFHANRVLGASALAFIASTWYWGVDRAGALGAVLALALTAAVLFWVSGRTGRAEESHD